MKFDKSLIWIIFARYKIFLRNIATKSKVKKNQSCENPTVASRLFITCLSNVEYAIIQSLQTNFYYTKKLAHACFTLKGYTCFLFITVFECVP